MTSVLTDMNKDSKCLLGFREFGTSSSFSFHSLTFPACHPIPSYPGSLSWDHKILYQHSRGSWLKSLHKGPEIKPDIKTVSNTPQCQCLFIIMTYFCLLSQVSLSPYLRSDVLTFSCLTFHCSALLLAVACCTFLLLVRSALFPTRIKGMLLSPFTRKICSRNSWSQEIWHNYQGNSKSNLCWLKWVILCYWENAEKSFPTSEVVVSDGRVILLACCVQDVYLNLNSRRDELVWYLTWTNLLSIQHDFLSVWVSFCGFVILYKLVIHKLKQLQVKTLYTKH